MPNSNPDPTPATELEESFGDLLAQYEQSHSRKTDTGRQIQGKVIAVTSDSVFLDIGYKSEGILPLSVFQGSGELVKPGDTITVSVKGRDPEGYYQLSRSRVERPTDWPALEQAFAGKATIVGTVTGIVKGGLSVDVGVRAFLPSSRSGVRDAADLPKMVGQEITCRIIKLDVADEDVVVDRRVVVEEEERAGKERLYSQLKEGDTVSGTVRSLTDYGAFVDIGGVDALLHVGDIAWARINKPADALAIGQEIEARVLRIDAEKRRISIGLKQLQPNPWESAAQKYKLGERARGSVSRLTDFGAFVELEPGIEGLIHISEMSWGKKVRSPADLLKPGEIVEAVILGVNPSERRISLGLKQALGDPWADVPSRFAPGTVIEGPITNITRFGAFVQLAEGVEGMIHVSDISAEKRINHPQEVLKAGRLIKAQVLAVDKEKRQLRLGIKQLAPTGLDEYLAERKAGDTVSGRILDLNGERAQVELGEGIVGSCRLSAARTSNASVPPSSSRPDLSSLTSMLEARWKSGPSTERATLEPPRVGQIRSFRIVNLDPAGKNIELEPL